MTPLADEWIVGYAELIGDAVMDLGRTSPVSVNGKALPASSSPACRRKSSTWWSALCRMTFALDFAQVRTVCNGDRMMASISAGRWVAMHRGAPYLRPSFTCAWRWRAHHIRGASGAGDATQAPAQVSREAAESGVPRQHRRSLGQRLGRAVRRQPRRRHTESSARAQWRAPARPRHLPLTRGRC